MEAHNSAMDDEPEAFEDACEAMRRRVFSTVAHDLKTPLACIIGALESLEMMKEKLSLQQREALVSLALDQANRLNTLFTRMIENVAPK
jgi:K+-sensing histidine kinase KdpD